MGEIRFVFRSHHHFFSCLQLQPQLQTIMSSKKRVSSRSNKLIKDIFLSRLKEMFFRHLHPDSEGWVVLNSRNKITRHENVDQTIWKLKLTLSWVMGNKALRLSCNEVMKEMTTRYKECDVKSYKEFKKLRKLRRLR